MSKIIAFANQKGGVGKTTSAINIAASLGVLGKKVLLCDFDPQSNASSGVGMDRRSVKLSIYDAIIGRTKIHDAVVRTKFANLFVLPSSINLAGGELEFASDNDNERPFRLKKILAEVADEYDYIIIDCQPSLGLLTINALCAATHVAVAMQCEYFALEGLTQLTSTVRQIKKLYNPPLELLGLIITMYDGRLNLSIQVMEELKKYFPDKIFKSLIPRTVRLSEAPSYGMPIYYYDKTSKATENYLAIAADIDKMLN